MVKRLYAAAKDDARREYEADVSRMSRIMVGLQEESDAHAVQAADAQARADQLQEELAAAKTMIDDLETQVLRGDEAKTLLEASARGAQQDLDRANELIASLKQSAAIQQIARRRMDQLADVMADHAVDLA